MKNQDYNAGIKVNAAAQKVFKNMNNFILIQGMFMCIVVLCTASTFAQGQPKATSDYTTTLLVNQTPKEAFDAINNVRGW